MPILIGNKFLFMLDSIFSKGYTDTEINHDSDFLREDIEKALESLRFDNMLISLAPLMNTLPNCFLVNLSGP